MDHDAVVDFPNCEEVRVLGQVNRIVNSLTSRAASPVWPKDLTEAVKTQREAHLDKDGKIVKTRISDGRELDLGQTTKQSIPPRSFGAFISALRNSPDAGNAIFAPDNATMATLRYTYGTHKSMEAWITDAPKDGKLVLNMVISPSIHAGSDRAAKLKNFELFGKTNIYNLEILYPDGNRDLIRFDVDGNADPKNGYEAKSSQAATLSPDVTIDMEKYKGQDVKLRGWADGSAGVSGYQERRETILHL